MKAKRKIAKLFFLVNTLSVLSLLELLIWGLPYLSLFVLIFTVTLYYNYRLFNNRRKEYAEADN